MFANLPRLMAVSALFAAPVWAAEPANAVRKGRPAQPGDATVELFAAKAAGDLKVKFVPKDDTVGRLIIENQTKRPLNVRLPEAFAGVPVLAQPFGGGAPFGNFANNNGGGSQTQAVGGGIGANNNNGLNFGANNPGPVFNIPAEKVGELNLALVCLEHGKKEPRPAVAYDIKPIESYSTDPQLAALLKLYGQGRFPQRVAQAAAWHLANGMSFRQLAAKRVRHPAGPTRSFFSRRELDLARQAAGRAKAMATQEAKGKESSLSQR